MRGSVQVHKLQPEKHISKTIHYLLSLDILYDTYTILLVLIDAHYT